MAWVGAVELTPASERPFVDSSPVNSMVDLVFDHNALQRFFPRAGTEPADIAAISFATAASSWGTTSTWIVSMRQRWIRHAWAIIPAARVTRALGFEPRHPPDL
jgi:hypothetical protein